MTELAEAPAVIGNRFQVLRKLGGGGMAVVFEVLDTTSGRSLALKRPRTDANPTRRKKTEELFALEYHTLSQLAHPRIVQVYDYGIDQELPYYTMELLDGGDLQQLVPAPYLRVCAIARDVCSALSLLHSRRIVHRDVNPRNIRCAADGTAKLIDFGAMALMGPSKELVGTPAYCAPEVLHLQPLAPAIDLYALGATLYYALTGRHAYPARDFSGLPDAWRFDFARPSELVPGIPAALDALVVDLLQLDERQRPGSASEVMDRLAAIEGRTVDEHLRVAQAYLATPSFVGRERELLQVKQRLPHGGAFSLQGASGVGRSRFLDACVLAAKLAGVGVLRADADDAKEGDWGAVRALLRQLRRQWPQLSERALEPDLDLLLHAAPELAPNGTLSPRAQSDTAALRVELQQSLRRFWLRMAEHTQLFFAIDDLHLIDEPSAAALALLASDRGDAAIVLVATSEESAQALAPSACRLFEARAERIRLQNLSAAETTSLLASVFGAHAEMSTLAARVFAITQGNPRDIMRLAQHLVHRRVARYRAGAWSLPAQLNEIELPSSVKQVLAARVSAFSPSTRALARAFALCAEQSFSFHECASLAPEPVPGQVLRDLGRLIRADVLRAFGDRLMLIDRAWVEVILAGSSASELSESHMRLAQTFEAREGEEFRTAQHLLRAGERERALDLLIAHAEASLALTDTDSGAFFKLVRALPADALHTYREAITLCRQLERPQRQSFVLRTRMAGIATITDVRECIRVSRDLIDELRGLAGLCDWDALDPALEPMQRLTEALGRTQARYDSAPEHARVLDPISAIRTLGRNYVEFIGGSVALLDLAGLCALQSLAPLAVLSPALLLIDDLAQGVRARLSGRLDRAREIYRDLLERTTVPEQTGLTESHLRYMRLVLTNGLALIEASLGLPSSLQHVAAVESDPMFRVNAVLIRMLYSLWQGDCEEADRYRRQVDVLRVESIARHAFETTHLVWQVCAHAALGDLARLKRTIAEVEASAGDNAGWRPVLAFARAEYQRLIGDLPEAIAAYERVLSGLQSGEHQLWANLAGAHVRALDEAGRTQEAVEHAERYWREAGDAHLGFTARAIRLPLCVARARLGHADAAAQVEEEIEALEALGTTGLSLALAFDARARIAELQADDAALAHFSRACEAALGHVRHAAFARRRQPRMEPVNQLSAMLNGDADSDSSSLLQSKLALCRDAGARAQLALCMLAERAHANAGHMFQVQGGQLHWTASLGLPPPAAELTRMVGEYLQAQLQGDEQTTNAQGDSVVTIASFADPSFRPVMLTHYAGALYTVTGVALLMIDPSRAFSHPSLLANQVSRLSRERGDASGLTLIDEDR